MHTVLKEMGVPNQLICLLRNLYVGQLVLDMELIGSKLGKEYDKAVYCLPAYSTYIQLLLHFYLIYTPPPLDKVYSGRLTYIKT